MSYARAQICTLGHPRSAAAAEVPGINPPVTAEHTLSLCDSCAVSAAMVPSVKCSCCHGLRDCTMLVKYIPKATAPSCACVPEQTAALQPEDFEATYNHALALQELASHTANQADEQLRLLQQV